MIDLNALGGLKEDERVEDDVIYCKNCNTARSDVLTFDGETMYFRIPCECMEKKIKLQQRVKEIKENSLLSERYKNVSFDTTMNSGIEKFDYMLKRCKDYCEHAEEALKNGWGIYLYGSKGTGKTHLAACIANSLMEQGYELLFTNFFEITKEIKATYNKSSSDSEIDLINRVTSIDFLVIDDIGTESMKKNGEDTWIQEKIYDVLNKRYNAQKPTIFTSNNSFSELINERGMMDKSVDRMMEMSTMILKFEGQSYRREMRKVALPF